MRFLIDASLSPVVADRLRAAGHDAVHVGEALRVDAPDSAVLDHAAEHERVIVAADTDFGTLLARRSTSKPSFVLFRRQTGRRPAVQAALLLDPLARHRAGPRGRRCRGHRGRPDPCPSTARESLIEPSFAPG
jgi:predicted nuclease of predicted toxin-antitoxin system